MDIYYSSKALRDRCSTEKKGIRYWGEPLAKKIRQRIKEFEAATNLGQISTLPPPRCHELRNNRAGQFAVVISANMRIIFEPYHEQIPLLPDGGVDKSRVTRIRILEVTDYHDD